MSLSNENIAFEYFTENSEKFAKDFTFYVKTDIPLFALQDELLYIMHEHQATSFKIPGYKCVDGRDHIFYFTVTSINEYPATKIFHYIGMDVDKVKNK